MKLFLDPFPFRNPENRSDLAAVISEITSRGEQPKDKGYAKVEKTPAPIPPSKSGKRYDKVQKVTESHTRAQLEKMTTTRLRELKKKYEGLVVKGDRDAARELTDIRGLLRAKGAGSVLDEATEGDTHGGGATSVKRETPPATAKKFRGVPAPVVYTPTTPRVTEPLKVSEGCGECTTDAIKSLKAANTADLKDKPGAAGKAAHKRLHKTIGKVLKGTK